jgi:hypothetical protein
MRINRTIKIDASPRRNPTNPWLAKQFSAKVLPDFFSKGITSTKEIKKFYPNSASHSAITPDETKFTL